MRARGVEAEDYRTQIGKLTEAHANQETFELHQVRCTSFTLLLRFLCGHIYSFMVKYDLSGFANPTVYSVSPSDTGCPMCL